MLVSELWCCFFPDQHAVAEEAENSSADLIDTTIGSESVLSFQGAMSLDSSTLQDFGSLVSLPPGALAGLLERHCRDSEGSFENAEDHTRSTIISSAASGANIPPPEASHDIWAVSPHPHLVSNYMQAMSTVCTDTLSYQRFTFGEVASEASSQHGKYSSEVSSSSHSRGRSPLTSHQREAFEAIANRLMRDVGSTSGRSSSGEMSGAWFGRYTDADWERLREVAKVVLATTGPRKMLLPLPPSPTVHTYPSGLVDGIHQRLPRSYRAQDMVSSSFICPCCNDVLVGALALDCGCTLCATCWESGGAFAPAEAEHEGYVWVNRRECTNCGSVVHSTILCHSLDVAICQVVETLEAAPHDSRLQNLRLCYYSRLEAWRETVVARNELAVEQQVLEEDELLARLIQQEEEVIWGNESRRQKTFTPANGFWVVIFHTTVAVLAGTLSSVVLQAVAKRR